MIDCEKRNEYKINQSDNTKKNYKIMKTFIKRISLIPESKQCFFFLYLECNSLYQRKSFIPIHEKNHKLTGKKNENGLLKDL